MTDARNKHVWYRQQSEEVIEAIEALLAAGHGSLAIANVLKQNGVAATKSNIQSYIDAKKRG